MDPMTDRLYAALDALPRPSFGALMLLLAAAFVYRHGVHVELGGDATAAVASHADLGPPRAQLASFKHPASHSADDVERLRYAYIERYAPLAVEEMEAYGIPASITLAQGLLESVAGTSRLAAATNNHFGMKCFSKSCAPGHCHNFDDDHHKDFFRVYEHPRESYRAHSDFLRGGKRYARLFELTANDYEGWAHGLRACGYATDPKYGDKLVSLIERYGLAAYDE